MISKTTIAKVIMMNAAGYTPDEIRDNQYDFKVISKKESDRLVKMGFSPYFGKDISVFQIATINKEKYYYKDETKI